MPHFQSSLFSAFEGLIAIMTSNFHLSLYPYPLSGYFSIPSTERSEKIFLAWNSEFNYVTCFVRGSWVDVAAGLFWAWSYRDVECFHLLFCISALTTGTCLSLFTEDEKRVSTEASLDGQISLPTPRNISKLSLQTQSCLETLSWFQLLG